MRFSTVHLLWLVVVTIAAPIRDVEQATKNSLAARKLDGLPVAPIFPRAPALVKTTTPKVEHPTGKTQTPLSHLEPAVPKDALPVDFSQAITGGGNFMSRVDPTEFLQLTSFGKEVTLWKSGGSTLEDKVFKDIMDSARADRGASGLLKKYSLREVNFVTATLMKPPKGVQPYLYKIEFGFSPKNYGTIPRRMGEALKIIKPKVEKRFGSIRSSSGIAY